MTGGVRIHLSAERVRNRASAAPKVHGADAMIENIVIHVFFD